MSTRIHLRLYGGVQGVGFRYFTARLARELGLAGYVRNLTDGSVEVEAEGDAPILESFRRRVCDGPPHATVRNVDDLPPGGEPLPHPFETCSTGSPRS